MKRLALTTATLLVLSLIPALAAGCCGKGGKGMCAKSTSSMSMNSNKKGCCCDKMAKKMEM